MYPVRSQAHNLLVHEMILQPTEPLSQGDSCLLQKKDENQKEQRGKPGEEAMRSFRCPLPMVSGCVPLLCDFHVTRHSKYCQGAHQSLGVESLVETLNGAPMQKDV